MLDKAPSPSPLSLDDILAELPEVQRGKQFLAEQEPRFYQYHLSSPDFKVVQLRPYQRGRVSLDGLPPSIRGQTASFDTRKTPLQTGQKLLFYLPQFRQIAGEAAVILESNARQREAFQVFARNGRADRSAPLNHPLVLMPEWFSGGTSTPCVAFLPGYVSNPSLPAHCRQVLINPTQLYEDLAIVLDTRPEYLGTHYQLSYFPLASTGSLQAQP